MMYLVRVSAVTAVLALSGAASAHAQAAFDMKGGWSGTGESIVRGSAAHHPAGDAAKPAGNARLREVTFTYKIDGQDGGRFWGTVASRYATESVIGVIAADRKRVYIVTEFGFVDGVITDNDTIDICYRELKPSDAVVACNVIKRTK